MSRRNPANGPSGNWPAICSTARSMGRPRVSCWERYPPGRLRRRNWRSCASCSTNMERGRDDCIRATRTHASGEHRRLDVISFAVGRRAGRTGSAGDSVRRTIAARPVRLGLRGNVRNARGICAHVWPALVARKRRRHDDRSCHSKSARQLKPSLRPTRRCDSVSRMYCRAWHPSGLRVSLFSICAVWPLGWRCSVRGIEASVAHRIRGRGDSNI